MRAGALLGVDVGTASSKAVLARPDGTVLAVAETPHELSLPRPGWAEHDAERVWWADLVGLCRTLGADALAEVEGVCVSGVGPCALPCDADGRPLRPAILYGIDTRATAQIAALERELGAEAILARCGSRLSSQAVGPKLRWLAEREPEVWRRTARLHMPSSFAVQRLTGEYVLDHHSASQCDPLYDIEASDWAHDWAATVAPNLPLPRLAWPAEVAGEVTAAAASETGLRAGTPVAVGTIDAWAEAFSVGVRRPGDLMLMYGSTMFFVQVLAAPRRDPSLWTTAGVEPHSRCLAGGMATAGSLTAWLRELVGEPSWETLLAEAEATPPGADGLLVLPHFAGERTPILDPDARGTVAGLTLRHGRPQLARAAYEGIAYGVRHNLETLAAAGGGERRIVAVGGGTRAPLWPQIVSDVAQTVQQLPEQTVGAAYGDALLAAIATGLAEPADDWTRITGELRPDAAVAERYDELYTAYRDLYAAAAPVNHRLAAMQTRGEANRDG
ncbi:FGGY-family carbohydrate kinase [Conexibacter woesei]|uniref:Carbohydrate kinase, FGGY-like protein n=1 Tax=Conexibacter woesei (strain DSM 14684 / CCUG 47730 / CIP 108061 / JCM 11494 / NBRC 100937 / ID131577) TaxID=469383 RepID=D3F3N8_CONWI|nr:FGGY-family carbohydrate kinase [Conexibacter woesei]ADB52403.1 Carbohydrate kinase, FGGY-like protein [Conexibacter woesei DSM 14684]